LRFCWNFGRNFAELANIKSQQYIKDIASGHFLNGFIGVRFIILEDQFELIGLFYILIEIVLEVKNVGSFFHFQGMKNMFKFVFVEFIGFGSVFSLDAAAFLFAVESCEEVVLDTFEAL
jgi:hypothetical protein